MRLNSSDEFVAGRHRIARGSDLFMERFHGLTFAVPENSEYLEHFIRRPMTDDEIHAELKPEECTLGDFFNLLHQPSQWPWSLCYLRDKGGELRVVQFRLQDGEWHLDASPSYTGTWNEIQRVYGPRPSGAVRKILKRLGLG